MLGESSILDLTVLIYSDKIGEKMYVYWMVSVILLAGDVEINPGPGTTRIIRALSLNVCSLRSIKKQATFQHIIGENNADLIAGCESKLYKDILNKEIFPPGYNVYRKDRDTSSEATPGGGVFLLISNLIQSEPLLMADTHLEVVGAKIFPVDRRKPIYVLSTLVC